MVLQVEYILCRKERKCPSHISVSNNEDNSLTGSCRHLARGTKAISDCWDDNVSGLTTEALLGEFAT